MKNLLVIAAVMFAFAATSCKKDYNCECTGGIGDQTYDMGKQSEDDAKSECNTFEILHDECTAKKA